jgi:phosphate transport system permease protein
MKGNIERLSNKDRWRTVKNMLFKSFVVCLTLISLLPLIWIVYYILRQGISAFSWHLITNLPKPVGEEGGGISNAIIGTLMLIIIAAIIAIPVGVLAGVHLAENKSSRLNYWIGLSVEVLQGIPSIVIGIAVYTWVVKPLHTFSALSGGVALSLMMLPIIIRSTEETLKLIPGSLKEASLALGASYSQTIFKVVLPTAASGIFNGITLSIARIMGETAPLLFTAFGNPYMNYNVLKPVQSLPLLIFNYATSPYDDWHRIAWAASFVLLVFIFIINTGSRLITKRWRVQF